MNTKGLLTHPETTLPSAPMAEMIHGAKTQFDSFDWTSALPDFAATYLTSHIFHGEALDILMSQFRLDRTWCSGESAPLTRGAEAIARYVEWMPARYVYCMGEVYRPGLGMARGYISLYQLDRPVAIIEFYTETQSQTIVVAGGE